MTLPGLVGQLLQDGAAVVRAEIQLFKSRIGARIAAARTGIILLVAAALVVILGLIGMVVALVLALLPYVGALLAGVIVLAATLIVAGILGWIGARQLSRKPEAAVEALPKSVTMLEQAA